MNRLTFTSLLVNFGEKKFTECHSSTNKETLVIGLKLENVTIPQYGVKDGWVNLFCDFQLEDDTLLVLKWYKDQHEFFRYSPQIRPPILDFPVEGVYVNVTQSGMNHVVLRNISLKTGGSYKCEVSADSPSFRTLSKQGDLLVIAPPSADPEITGIHPALSVGDTLMANCTSFHSQPAASLNFYLNEEKAETSEIREYLPVAESNGLETSILGLRFIVEPRHFRHGVMVLKCTATIGNSYRVKRVSIAEANINAQPSIPNNRPLLSGATATNILTYINLYPSVVTIIVISTLQPHWH